MKILTNNIRLKAVAFVIAVGLWLFVYSEHHQRLFATYSVKIIYTKLDPRLEISGPPRGMYIRFKGSAKQIENLDPLKIWAEADLKKAKAGTNAIKLKLHNTAGAETYKTNLNMKLLVKKKDNVVRPLDIAMRGQAPSGKTPGAPIVRINDISFYGNQKDLARIRKAVASVNLSGRARNFTVDSKVSAVDDSGKTMKDVVAFPQYVKISVPIFDAVSRQRPVQLIYRGRMSDADIEVTPQVSPPSVSLFGDEKVLDRMRTAQTVEFDAERCRRGETFIVKIDTPNNVSASPTGVTVSCKVPPRGASRSFVIRIEPMNLGSELHAELQPPSVEVKVTGDAGFVSKLTSDKIAAKVDLLGKIAGTYLLTPEVFPRDVIEGVEIDFVKKPVRVTLTKE